MPPRPRAGEERSRLASGGGDGDGYGDGTDERGIDGTQPYFFGNVWVLLFCLHLIW
jgi:hypothetical protein